MKNDRSLFLGDMHLPFANLDAIHEAWKFNQKFKAHKVYQMGDFVDFYGFSKFAKDPSAPNVALELKKAKEQSKWVAKWFPNMTILMGNHEKRLYKRAAEAGIPTALLPAISSILELPKGLKYIPKDYLLVGDTVLTHGHLTSANAKKAHAEFYTDKNVIHGHIHNQLGIEYIARSENKRWGMSVACMADQNSIAMAYGAQDWKNIIVGFGYKEGNRPGVVCLS